MQLHEQEELFGRLGIKLGLFDQEKMDAVCAIKKSMADMGIKPKDLATLFIEKEYLSLDQAKFLRDKVKSYVPQKIAGFEIREKLGQGAMGAVYKAHQLSMSRDVAIKVLASHLKAKKTYVDRFLLEARAVGRLQHPNIVSGIDAGVEEGIYYFAMEFVEGTTVGRKLRREGVFSEAEAIDIGIQMARALECAHKHGFIHRDVKPDNIMINDEGVAKLCDLGLVKSFAEDTSLTQAGTSMGTPDYISPEQASGVEDLDIRCDIYSLGCSLWHMVVGDVPFLGDNPNVIMAKHIQEPLPELRKIAPNLSDGFVQILEAMLEKDRSDRQPSPTVLLGEFESLRRGEMTTTSSSDSRGGRTSSRSGRSKKGTSKVAGKSGVRNRRSSAQSAGGGGGSGVMVGVGVGVCAVIGLLFLAGRGGGDSENVVEYRELDPSPVVKPINRPGKTVPKTVSEAEKEFGKLRDYAADHPQDYRGISRRCQDFLDRPLFEDSDFRGDVEVLLEETGKRAEEDANAQVVQAEGEIEKGNLSRNYARKIERYERLREELDRAGLRNTRSFETVVDDIRIWKASMADTWRLHCQDAAAARVEKNYEKAIASYRKSEGYGDEAIASQRHTLIAETEAERDREQDRARLDQQKIFEKMMKEFGEALGERRFDALAAIVKSREKMFTLDPYRKWLARVREDVQIFSALDQSARRGAEMLYAEKAEVGYKGEDRRGKFFRLTKVKEDRYTIRLSSGAETGESFSALVRGRLDLLNPFILNDPKLSEGQYFLVMGVLLLFDVNSSRTQLDRAGRMLEMAGSLGEDVERFGALSSWKRQEYDEREARQLLKKALESEERARSSKEFRKRLKPLAQARSAYEFLLKELSETQVVRDARAKIEKNLEGLDSLLPEPEEPEEPEKGAGRAPSLEELFAGRVIEVKGGRVRLEYDFKDESQFEKDWDSDPEGDGSFEWDEAGELYGVGVRTLYFKAPLKGDFRVEVQFEYGPEVGNFGLSFNNNLKREAGHRSYLLVTSVKAREDQPWWFRPMIGSHIGKHMLSCFNGGLPQIESKPDPVLRPKEKGHLVVSVQGDEVVVEINGKKVFGGRRNGPRDGSIGLVLFGGKVRVHEVKIEGTIRKDWLDEQAGR